MLLCIDPQCGRLPAVVGKVRCRCGEDAVSIFSDTELDMSGLAEGGVCRAVNVADPLNSDALLTARLVRIRFHKMV
jgi:hypothetical protein